MTEQADRALVRANEVRLKRSAFKRGLASFDSNYLAAVDQFAKTLRERPDYLDTMTVGNALLVLPMFGGWRIRKICHKTRIPEGKRLGDLTDRQMTVLLDAVHADVARMKRR